MEALLAKLGGSIEDVDEELFDVFSQPSPTQDLGMVDAKAEILEIAVAGRDFEIRQSPGILQSARGGGTTGAAVWRASIKAAEWLSWPRNPLFHHGIIGSDSTVLELGAGISGVLPCILSSKVKNYIVTDQAYVLKSIRENIATNLKTSRQVPGRNKKNGYRQESNIDVISLDWEEDDVPSVLSSNGLGNGVDCVIVCDCIFNYALIDPLVQTCKQICQQQAESHRTEEKQRENDALCVVVQQLRQPEVFEQWLETFRKSFRVWRVPDELLCPGMQSGTGYIVHIGLPRGDA